MDSIIRETLPYRRKPKNTTDLYKVAVTFHSFTIVGHVTEIVISFQIVEYGILTDLTNRITNLAIPIIYIGGFQFCSLLPKPPMCQI